MPETKTFCASEIPVNHFRQIHHLPLIWQGRQEFDIEKTREKLEGENWKRESDALDLLLTKSGDYDPGVFAEFVYFHDFARNFLYPDPKAKNPPFYLFKQENPGRIEAEFSNGCGAHSFEIERLTLHLFRTGTAIMTVETRHESKTSLHLGQVQTIIDHFRRSYTPYWNEKEEPGGVPVKLKLLRQDEDIAAKQQTRQEMLNFLKANRASNADAPLLEPWKTWTSAFYPSNWRDPSDERVPVMSYIELAKTGESAAQTMQRIREGDWFRLAEADEEGAAGKKNNEKPDYSYNPDFLKPLGEVFFYDRFFPDTGMDPDLATRQIFGGNHYSFVTVEGADFLRGHFRRHYEKLAFAARFEFATLLAFSSRLTRLVEDFENNGSDKTLRHEVNRTHEEFLAFTHRYRFTGITNQIQGAEMFERWRRSLGLDRLYEDVKNEITSASEFALATQANMFAKVGLIAAAILAAPGLKDFKIVKSISACLGGGGWAEILVPFAITGVLAGVVYWLFVRPKGKK